MVFSSTVFMFLFLPTIIVLYYCTPFNGRHYRNVLLLLASLLFYGWGEPVFVFLMVFSILFTYVCGCFLRRRFGIYVFWGAVAYHIAILFVFKYLRFVTGELGLLMNCEYKEMNIVLPIGISFFTFQLLSYLFDVYTGKAEPQRNPLYLGLYVALFPQLIAGPIVRYEDIEKQIINRNESWNSFEVGMNRFTVGLAKKVLIANYMAQIADNAFDYFSELSISMAWYGAIAYALQIYFDFSGYSDMAIGLGRMFGFRFHENFRYPYIAKTITDFWRRWHISLSTWFRDYVYIPLGGNRVSTPYWIRNLFSVWILTGIWHGANWTFVFWGVAYFTLLLLEKVVGMNKKSIRGSRIYTLTAIVILWVVFRSEGIVSAFAYVGNMLGINANGFVDRTFIECWNNTKILFGAAVIGVTPIPHRAAMRLNEYGMNWICAGGYLLLFCASILQIIGSTYNPFIYFNF